MKRTPKRMLFNNTRDDEIKRVSNILFKILNGYEIIYTSSFLT